MTLKEALSLFKGKYEMIRQVEDGCNMVKLSEATQVLMDYANKPQPSQELQEKVAQILLEEYGIGGAYKKSARTIADQILALLPKAPPEPEKEGCKCHPNIKPGECFEVKNLKTMECAKCGKPIKSLKAEEKIEELNWKTYLGERELLNKLNEVIRFINRAS